jgi:hypothetical protein
MILARTSLGQSPLLGSPGVVDCIAVKKAVFRRLGHIDNAWMVITPGPDRTCSLEGAFPEGDAMAEVWVRSAQRVAVEEWERTGARELVR